MSQDEVDKEVAEWSPEKKALASQWLIQKQLDRLREKLPPEVFIGFAQSLELILKPWEIV